MAKNQAKITDIRNAVPNLFINGAMDFWQRGTVVTSYGGNAAIVLADRFKGRATGGGPTSDLARSTDVPNSNFTYSFQYNKTGGSGTGYTFGQRVEGVVAAPYSGRVMTASCWVKVNVAQTVSLTVSTVNTLDVWPDVGGDNAVTVTPASVALAANVWTRVSCTFTAPAATTKNGIGAFMNTGATGNYTAWTTGFMLTPGAYVADSSTPFYRARPTLASELVECQRFYEKSYDVGTTPGTVTTTGSERFRANGTNHLQQVIYRVTKRVAPTVTYYNPNTLNSTGTWRDLTGAADRAVALQDGSDRGGSTSVTSVDGNSMAGHWVGDAEIA